MNNELKGRIADAINILKGGDDMAILDLYVGLVMTGDRTCIPADVTPTCKIVPLRYQEQVIAVLLSLGLDGSGNMILA